MEKHVADKNDKYPLLFCETCKSILENITIISKSSDLEDLILNKIKFDYENQHFTNCFLCLNIFRKITIDELVNEILENSKNLKFENFRLTLGFSPLFSLIHAYIKRKLLEKQDTDVNKHNDADNGDSIDYNLIDVSILRKVFKPLIIPILMSKTKKTNTVNSNTELKISFEFPDSLYSKTFEYFNHIPIVKKIGEKKFRTTSIVDRGNINEMVKVCSKELFSTIIESNSYISTACNDLRPLALVIRDNIYYKGSYLKYSREIGQSPWEINGIKVCFSSVQEEINKSLIHLFKCDSVTMHASGREDRDVRMLGTGRPLLLEVVNPRVENLPEPKTVEEAVNTSTDLIELKISDYSDKKYLDEIKKYEDSKRKNYICVVWSKNTITEDSISTLQKVKDLEIIQKTPLRVAHRRTLKDRKKVIYRIGAEIINQNFMVFYLLI